MGYREAMCLIYVVSFATDVALANARPLRSMGHRDDPYAHALPQPYQRGHQGCLFRMAQLDHACSSLLHGRLRRLLLLPQLQVMTSWSSTGASLASLPLPLPLASSSPANIPTSLAKPLVPAILRFLELAGGPPAPLAQLEAPPPADSEGSDPYGISEAIGSCAACAVLEEWSGVTLTGTFTAPAPRATFSNSAGLANGLKRAPPRRPCSAETPSGVRV